MKMNQSIHQVEGTNMRICDNCKKALPLGTMDIVHVSAMGQVGKYFEKEFKSDSLDFCSLFCFVKFVDSIPPLNPSNRGEKK